jgi:hypothetical protein
MTQDEMPAGLQVGREWSLVRCGPDPLRAVEHWCGGLYGHGRTYTSETVTLPHGAWVGIEVF